MASVLFFFALFYPLLFFLAKHPDRYFHQIARCRRVIGLLSSACVGIYYRVRFEAPVDWSRPYVICANHTSNLDITAMVLACPSDFSFIGKIELLDNPVTGLFFKTVDIPLDRQSKMSAFRAFKKAADRLSKGRSMVIFPEGHIGEEYPPQLYSFKNGPFRLAIEAGIPVLPVVIHNAWQIHWDEGRRLGSRPGIIRVDVLSPITTGQLQLADADTLRDEVHGLIKKRWTMRGGL